MPEGDGEVGGSGGRGSATSTLVLVGEVELAVIVAVEVEMVNEVGGYFWVLIILVSVVGWAASVGGAEEVVQGRRWRRYDG